MKKILNIAFSIKTSIVLLSILFIGAAAATFIENDYGTSTARVLVYYNWWYIAVLFATGINLAGVIYRRKMWRYPPRFLFHLAFLLIGLGAAITHFWGIEGILHIREGSSENRMLTAEPYLQVTIKTSNGVWYQEYQRDFSAIGNNRFAETIFFDGNRTINLKFVDYKFAKQGHSTMGLLRLKGCYGGKCETVRLVGQRGAKGYDRELSLGDVKLKLEFGSKIIKMPFVLKLKDFQIERYPGSMAPSSYASEISVVDGAKSFDYRIYMNHPLNYGGYKFFQSSYDKDERGTILSVNKDPGKWPTYIGYILLALALLLNLFDKRSRFGRLINYLRHSAAVLIVSAFVSVVAATPANAATPSEFQNYLLSYSKHSKNTAKQFGRLITQSPMGRMEPVNTLDTKLLYKIHKSISYKGMSPDQVMLGMISRPELWRYAKLIKIKSPKLKKVLSLNKDAKYISFADAFDVDNSYKLKKYVETANILKPEKRGTFEREVITLDEKLNVVYMIFYANLFKIYPMPDDQHHTWYNPLEASQKFTGSIKAGVETLTHNFIDSIINGNWDKASNAISQIAHYQQRLDPSLIPSKSKIDAELFYNHLNLFPSLIAVYMTLGLLFILVGFVEVVSTEKKKLFAYIRSLGGILVILIFAIHTFGLGLRWYISGHAPWSDAYESLLYISWAGLLAGLLFFRRSLLVMGATVTISGIFLFTAHLNNINPQITNLVPVLKSYWLTIHVSVITASYGFLGLSSILGFLILLLFIVRSPKKEGVDVAIYRLVAVDEAALIIGLSMLTVGNFIGGVWANESWGRYWGWDPKETWAYISIIVYTIVLHLRLIKPLDLPYILALSSFLAFASILMTYFGVNFYLSGLHSYATGDPVPVPVWVYVLGAIALVTIVLSYPKRGLERLKLKGRE